MLNLNSGLISRYCTVHVMTTMLLSVICYLRVNVDIDVPLFLPIYGQRRQYDLRKIALREVREGFRMSGQMNFDSGWEVGYWLSDVVTARASWDPKMPPVDKEGLENAVVVDDEDDQWEVFAHSLYPATKIFGDHYGPQLVALLVNLTRIQSEVLIHGIVRGVPSPDIHKLSGIAYLSGRDTWFEVPRLFGLHQTQPDSVGLKEATDPHWPHAQLLLQEMHDLFTDVSAQMDLLYEEVVAYASSSTASALNGQADQHPYTRIRFQINDAALNILYEFKDFTKLLALRSSQLRLLYQSKDPQTVDDSLKVSELQKQSRSILQTATEIVQRREQYYRTPWQRIAEWRDNPTVYRFTYLWAVHSLYYWWRDQGLAEQGSFQAEHSPCYLNRMDTSEVALGWGKTTLEVFRTIINRYTPFSAGSPLEIVNCLSPPSEGYQFPRDLYSFD